MNGLAAIPEHEPTTASSSLQPFHGNVGRNIYAAAPWKSPAVAELAAGVAAKKPGSTPLLVEGRAGTVLAAVGEQGDHDVANRALRISLQNPHGINSNRTDGALVKQINGSGKGNAVGGAVTSSVGGGRIAPSARGSARHGAAFGAVYEYRDSVGKPRYVSSTGEQPEAAFARDFHDHQNVRNLFEGVSEGPGRAKVVWAGVGGGPIGDQQLAAARDAVCKSRAERQHIAELQGAKPYSRHAHMLAPGS